MYRIREEHSRSIWQRSLFFLPLCSDRVAFQDIVSTFRAFYFVLYGGGATGFCSVEYPMSLMYRLSANATRVRGVWKIDKDLTGGAYRACCNEFYV
jgi:hypothetical protein